MLRVLADVVAGEIRIDVARLGLVQGRGALLGLNEAFEHRIRVGIGRRDLEVRIHQPGGINLGSKDLDPGGIGDAGNRRHAARRVCCTPICWSR
jgi:hypothetical protein